MRRTHLKNNVIYSAKRNNFQEIYNICTQTVVLNGCRINIKRYMCVCKLSKWYFTKQGVMVTGQVI